MSKDVETHVGTKVGIKAAKEDQFDPKRNNKIFKEPKTCIFKNHKKTRGFLKVVGYKGISRKPQENKDGSQKTPKKIPNPKEWKSKNETKNFTKDWTQFSSTL